MNTRNARTTRKEEHLCRNDLEMEELEAHIQRLELALSEIGQSASEALLEEHVADWAEGGRLGDALIGIKDIVDTALQEEN